MFMWGAPVVLTFSFAACWENAERRTGMKRTVVAMRMGMGLPTLSECIQVRKRFPYDRLLMAVQNDEDVARFYQALQDEIAAALSLASDPLAQIERALPALRRMVKASVTRSQERKSA